VYIALVGCFVRVVRENSILPLVKARRAKMNSLTLRLNAKIKSVVAEYTTKGAPLSFVDTDPHFEVYRFCEAGSKSPVTGSPTSGSSLSTGIPTISYFSTPQNFLLPENVKLCSRVVTSANTSPASWHKLLWKAQNSIFTPSPTM
jgi:hypothetical protein